MKKEYTQAELEILSLDERDVIVTSPTTDPNETKPMPIGGTSGNRDGIDPYYKI